MMENIQTETHKPAGFLKSLANIISYLFHPLLIPTYTVLIVFNQDYFFFSVIPVKYKLYLFAFVFALSFLLPLIFIMILKKMAYVRDYQMDYKNERSIPLLITGLSYYLIYFLFGRLNLPYIISNFFLLCSSLIVLALIINFFWKISLHTIAIGGLIGLLLALLIKYQIDTRLWFLISVFVAGLIGFARLALEKHTQTQVYSGYLLGFSVIFGFYYFF